MRSHDSTFIERFTSSLIGTQLGLWKENLTKQTLTVFNHEIVGIPSGTLTFEEYMTFLSPQTIEIMHDELLRTENIGNSQIITIQGRFVEVRSFMKETDENNDLICWGIFRVIENEDSANELNNYKSFIEGQNFIAKALTSFLNNSNIDESINEILANLLKLLDGSRCYIVEYDFVNQVQNNTYEVVAEGIAPEIQNLQELPLDSTPYWNKCVRENKPIIAADINDLPPEAESDKAILAAQDIESILIIPLPYKDAVWGYLGIDIVGRKRSWNNLDYLLVSSLATIIGICIELHSAERNATKLVSQLEANEIELIAAKEKAEAMDKLKSAFLANMSHEIRTPLNAIVGFSNIITSNGDNIPQEDKDKYLSIIQNNSDLLLQLISDVLDLSKIESGILEFNFSNTNINQLIREAISLPTLTTKPKVSLITNLPLESCIVYCDKNRLAQVINNFLTNALKFTDKGSITLGYNIIDDYVELYVEDTGMGISQANQELIFNSFVKLNSFIAGTGLGLAISKSIIEQMHGTIGVNSELGKGSKFWCRLPYSKHDSFIPTKNEPKRSNIRNLQDSKNIVILLAEDDKSNRHLIQYILKSYTIICAENGAEAIELCAKYKPDIIIMDIKMPEVDGITATKTIRESNNDVPIIAVTAYGFNSDKQLALDAGCNEYITKPLNPDQLLAAIEKYT